MLYIAALLGGGIGTSRSLITQMMSNPPYHRIVHNCTKSANSILIQPTRSTIYHLLQFIISTHFLAPSPTLPSRSKVQTLVNKLQPPWLLAIIPISIILILPTKVRKSIRTRHHRKVCHPNQSRILRNHWTQQTNRRCTQKRNIQRLLLQSRRTTTSQTRHNEQPPPPKSQNHDGGIHVIDSIEPVKVTKE